MVQPGEPDSNGKFALGYDSSELRTEYQCPTCFKIFYSATALCGHQNVHRLVREPMKMSPVLAAVLNNPPPPFHKPFLLPPRPKPSPGVGGASRAAKELNPNQLQDKVMGKTTPEGDGFLRRLLGNMPRFSHPNKTVVPEHLHTQSLTKDLLGEWMPLTGFGDGGELGTSSGKMLSLAVTRNYTMDSERGRKREREADVEPEAELDLELSLRTGKKAKGVDLELKLGR